MKLIGRKREKATLQRVLGTDEPEFLAVYGRRRVGKTYLIREFCQDKGLFFEVLGQKDASLAVQLSHFYEALTNTFRPELPLKAPNSWNEAFHTLGKLLEMEPERKRKIVFLDELPWLAARRSGVMQALEYAWNKTWSTIPNLKLIVCGSAASWMLNRVIREKGGLHNRLTQRIHLKPFSLKESKAYLASRGIHLKDEQTLEIYMVLGGIPYYLRQLDRRRSVSQNINALCFMEDGLLFDELTPLLASLFEHSETHEKMIRAIAERRYGMRREELIKASGSSSGGTLKKRLDELEASSFIQRVVPWGRKRKDAFFKIVDEYTLFYLHWIEPLRRGRLGGGSKSQWQALSKTPSYLAWSGYAFEATCLKHLDPILRSLDLEDVTSWAGTWQKKTGARKADRGVQIDLLIDRTDGAVTLCEMKHHRKPFSLDRKTAMAWVERMRLFQEVTHTEKEIFLALVTSHGLKPNAWSEELIHRHVPLSDLFR